MPASQYLGRIAALATQHGKESVIAPAFAEIAGLTVQVAAIDTDRFGTFSGEVKRSQAPLATAVKKALAGMSAENLRLGLASEGTIGPHPVSGFMNVDTEIIVFIDDELDLVITEKVQSSEIVAQTITAGPNDDLTDFLRKADFPRHGLIVKSDCPTSPEDPTARIAKGITDLPALARAVQELSANGNRVIIENDFRAHFSPSRMAVIGQCAELLAKRVAASCPGCGTPGWGHVDPIRGLACSDCGSVVEWAIQADRSGCQKCELIKVHPRLIQTVEPQWCNSCNP